MQPQRIAYGDAEYDTVWADWVVNGRSRQFTREGSWGGALYRVRPPEGVSYDADAYPDFYQVSSLGPTIVNQETGKVTDEGWHLANDRDGFRIEHWTDTDTGVFGGRVAVRHKDMPNELSVEDTV
jgi:hypothetical protein